MLAHESRTSAVEHDQLDELVCPAIEEAIGRAVLQEARSRQKVTRSCPIEADYECGRVNRVEQGRVRWRERTQVDIVGRSEVPVCHG